MKATSLLEKQHRKVEGIFKKLEGGRADAGPLLEQLANELSAHMAIEQDIFYPACREVDEDIIAESHEEHALAEIGLKRLLATDPEDDSFHAKVVVLKELLLHHIEEEETELFPKVERALGQERLESLGKQMKKEFDSDVDAGFEELVPRGYTKTSADQANRRAHRRAHHDGVGVRA